MQDGKLDQVTLEHELKFLFEDDFSKNVEIVQRLVSERGQETEETYYAMCSLTILGILGELRHPGYKEHLDKSMADFEAQIFSRIYGIEGSKIREHILACKKTPYSNIVGYISIALRIIGKLEPIDFQVYAIESNEHFLLPDTSCFQLRGQLKHYPNPYINEIIQIIIPISDKLCIMATPRSLDHGMRGICIIQGDNTGVVEEINLDLYNFAKKTVACKDEAYLKQTVERFKSMSESI